MKIVIAILITMLVCYPAGYLTCFFWGKSRKEIKDATGEIADEATKLTEGIKRQ